MGKIGGKVRNADEKLGRSCGKLVQARASWGMLGESRGGRWGPLRGGTRWSALGTAAGRDTGERAGARCGAGHGRSRWDPLRGGTQ